MNKLAIFIYLFIGFSAPFVGLAQQAVYNQDTVVRLSDVVIAESYKVGTSSNRQFSAGSQALRYNRADMAVVQSQSLSDYLQTSTPIYFKEYGKGMRSTISVRGTSASQTTVTWNGLDLNSATMGQTDFSLLPLFFFDEVAIHRSGESALYGNGAVGGSVQLQSLPYYEKKMALDLRQGLGSYGYLFSGLRVRVGGDKWESRTQALYTGAKNNFTFSNTISQKEESMNNANYRQYGVLQEIYFRPATRHELSLRAWYFDSKRQIQPFMSCNELPSYYDSISDRSLRLMAGYAANYRQFKMDITTAYSYDYELFKTDVIAANKFFAKGEAEYFLPALSLKAGAQVEYIRPDIHAYSADVHEWRTDIFLLARWQPSHRWTISGGVRQNFVTAVSVPLSPTLGMAYQLLNIPIHELTGRASASYNTKVPTLNDRYWGATNTYLLPETGRNVEAGFDYAFMPAQWVVRCSATGYYNRVKNWIWWTPIGQIWRPQNIGLVDMYGAELSGAVTKKIAMVQLEGLANYNYTAVVLLENASGAKYAIGKQVPYQPLHAANASLKIALHTFFFQTTMRYTGQRHTTDYFDYLDSYLLTDLNAGYTFVIAKKYTLSVLAQVANIFDTDYQNMKYFAMPGRTFTGTLNLKL